MKKLFVGLLCYVLSAAPVFAQATLLPNAKQTFLDSVGNPLVGGSVTSFVPNSTTKKTTWQDAGQTENNTNPVILDAAGRAVIYGQGNYRQLVKDANGNTIWDAPTSAIGSSQPSGATGTDTAPVGSVMVFSGSVVPVNWQIAAGQTLSRTDFSALLTAITISQTGISCTSGNATLSGWSDTSQMRVGAPVEAACIPTGSVIAAIPSNSSITLNNNAVSTLTVPATVYNWGNGDGTTTFNVPDLRGRVPAGADAMGGTAANRLTTQTTISTISGNTTASIPSTANATAGMSIISTNVPAGATISTVNPVTVTTILTTSGSPTATVPSSTGLIVGQAITSLNIPNGTTISAISGTTITMSANATGTATSPVRFDSASDIPVVISSAATATASSTSATILAFSGANAPASPGGSISHILTPSESASLSYSSAVTDPGHRHTLTTTLVDSSAARSTLVANGFGGTNPINTTTDTTGITVATTANAGNQAHSILQPTLTVNYIIKVKSNTSGAGGVVSLGGMVGDIICDATFLCAPNQSNVNSIGLATQPTNTMLANISGSNAQPVPNTWSDWMDSVCGSAQGDIVYRSATSWSCLPAGTSGFVLATQGASANPLWVANSNPSANQAANSFYAGPTSGGAAPPSFRTIVPADLPGTFSGFANPTAQVGPTVVNGTDNHAMRADAAPAFNTAADYTQTGNWQFKTFSSATTGATSTTALLASFANGSSGSPVNSLTPSVTVSRTDANTIDNGGDGTNSALRVNLSSNSSSTPSVNAQGVGLNVTAVQSGKGDIVGTYSEAFQDGTPIDGTHNNKSFGSFSFASITGTASINGAIAANNYVTNNNSIDCPIANISSNSACWTAGNLIQGDGTHLNTAGIFLQAQSTAAEFDTGVYVQSGSIRTNAFTSPGFNVDASGNVTTPSISGLTTPLSASQGGTGNAGGPFSTSTPAVVCGQSTGTAICTASMRRQLTGKRLDLTVTISISGTFTGGTITSVALPNMSASGSWVFAGRENSVTGTPWVGTVFGSATTMGLTNNANSNAISTGESIVLTGWYEIP